MWGSAEHCRRPVNPCGKGALADGAVGRGGLGEAFVLSPATSGPSATIFRPRENPVPYAGSDSAPGLLARRPVRTATIPCVERPLVRTGHEKIQRGAHEGVWCAQKRPRAHGARNTEHRAQSTEHRTQNTEHRARNTGHETRSTEHGTGKCSRPSTASS